MYCGRERLKKANGCLLNDTRKTVGRLVHCAKISLSGDLVSTLFRNFHLTLAIHFGKLTSVMFSVTLDSANQRVNETIDHNASR